MTTTPTKPTHTPGPWFIDGMGNDPHCLAITAGDQIDGPEFQREDKIAEVHTESDARLIAAAPDLLEVARETIAAYETMRDGEPTGHLWPDPSHIVKARNAIAKAEGRA